MAEDKLQQAISEHFLVSAAKKAGLGFNVSWDAVRHAAGGCSRLKTRFFLYGRHGTSSRCRVSAKTRQRWEHEYDLERRGARPAF
jgi:hypothetical protein